MAFSSVTGATELPRNVIPFITTPEFRFEMVKRVKEVEQGGSRTACVFDIDHTIFVPSGERNMERDTTIVPVAALIKDLHRETRTKIVLITARRLGGRSFDNFADTAKSLYNTIGAMVEFDERFCLICRDEYFYPAVEDEIDEDTVPGAEALIENVPIYKSEARAMVSDAGYYIVLNVGDQPGDFDGGTHFELGLHVVH